MGNIRKDKGYVHYIGRTHSVLYSHGAIAAYFRKK